MNRAGCHNGPDAFAPAVAGFAAGALCDEAVDDDESDGLFGDVVGGGDAGRGDESEIGVAVLVESGGDVAGGFVFRDLCCGGSDDFVSLSFKCALEFTGSHFITAVDCFEKFADFTQHSSSVAFNMHVVDGEQKFYVANQVGDAELDGDVEVVHVFSVCGEVVAADDTVELFAEHVDEDLAAA